MTSPKWKQTVPPPRELHARRDYRPNALLIAAAVMTVGVLLLSLSALLSGEPASPRQVAALGLLTSGIVGALIAVLWLIHPRPLPPYDSLTAAPPAVADGGAAVSPERPRGSWPWA